MKKFILLIISVLFIVGCSEEEVSRYQIGDEYYQLINTKIDSINLSIPNSFVELVDDAKDFKYDSDIERVFVDSKYNAELTFDYYELSVDNNTIPEYKQIIIATFKESDSDIYWLQDELLVIDGYNIARLEFYIDDDGVQIYYNLAILAFDNQVLDINFRSTDKITEWSDMINAMFETIGVKQDDED